jgi:hydrogenase maturation protein HypF
MSESITGLRLRITGIVQGVGFRPFIYALAKQLQLFGWVRNTSSGVEIEVDGTPKALDYFLNEIRHNPPPLAHIQSISSETIHPQDFTGFEIITSQPSEGDFLPISPDISTCPDCLCEMMDPNDRRYRYPFINCTNCGPRFTIIKDIPYDRPLTTMDGFPLCPNCLQEYNDPLNRRFHAQPIACPVCGPKVKLVVGNAVKAVSEDAIQVAKRLIEEGKIVAVKGLGGYLLACDATNPASVATLRDRKKRSDKPFALMGYDLQSIQQHCIVSTQETELLTSIQRPIVLLERKQNSDIVEGCAPNQHALGFMLPYTPLHYLLLEPAPGFPDVLVMTSGNLSEEPIAYDDEDAMVRLSTITDSFLTHNRPIHMRMDDSVTSISAKAPAILRRARGYAPSPIILPREVPSILATGAELKNTFCLTRQNQAFLSHHIGDLENYETLASFEQGILHYQQLFRINPEVVACDLHPDYLATRYASERAQRENLPLISVQHHHAHLAACLADNGIDHSEPVIGLCFDGTGYGTDGAIWGGEVLVGSYQQYQRRFHLEYTPLPGGDAAVHRPSRMALSWLRTLGMEWGPDLPPVRDLCYEERTIISSQLEHKINTPLTSSMGRLFDAVAALLGIREVATYEGQAAIEMESIADPDETGLYDCLISGSDLSVRPLLEGIINDWESGVLLSIISARFHNSIAYLSLQVCQILHEKEGLKTVALSGGVWQNRYLFTRTVYNLEADGFLVLRHHQVPVNDGCVALGQALVAAYQV